jgi:phosphoribosylglycinamide formyltransferase-1
MNKPKLFVFASGDPTGGGSGFKNLEENRRKGILDAEIVGVASEHENGGVRMKAQGLGIPFTWFPKPWTAERYQEIANESGAEYFALSGWLPMVKGLYLGTKFNSRTVFNIHPGPLPEFGGKGFYGEHVHNAVMDAFKRKEVTHSAVSMHFVTEKYDDGPVFLDVRIKIRLDEDVHSLGKLVNSFEHKYQPMITNMVVKEQIGWDGVDRRSLYHPPDYAIRTWMSA